MDEIDAEHGCKLMAFTHTQLDAFAGRIRAAEQARCAVLADTAAAYYTEHTYPDDIRAQALETLAAEIRKGPQ